MNERIQELESQCWEERKYGPAWFNSEKFAELIVKECAQAFESEVDTWKQMDPYQGSIKRQGAKAIKQHFGVGE